MNDLTPRERAEAALRELGLTLASATFIPHSQSTDREERRVSHKRLHWMLTIRSPGPGGELVTPYSAGISHLPIYRYGAFTADMATAVEMACETGRHPRSLDSLWPYAAVKPPELADVMYCLLSDADALEYRSFEDWAESLGYEPDSRKAEGIYRACMELALKLRYMLGNDGIVKLREAFQDY